MDRLYFGDIVLLKFPFTDGKSYKRRPAFVINDFNDGDIIVCRITSQVYETPYDICLDNWESYGLKLPSVLRVHKLATLEKSLIETKMGNIDNSIKENVKKVFNALIERY